MVINSKKRLHQNRVFFLPKGGNLIVLTPNVVAVQITNKEIKICVTEGTKIFVLFWPSNGQFILNFVESVLFQTKTKTLMWTGENATKTRVWTYFAPSSVK